MINLPIPQNLTKNERDLAQLLKEICRRAVDGTSPLSINVQITVANHDIEILTGGYGLVLPSRNGLHYGRVLLENPDVNGNLVISVDTIS